MNIARFSLTYAYLELLLKLPKDAKVVYTIQQLKDVPNRHFDIYITHPDLPEVVEGARPPECSPTFDENGLVDWNVIP